MGENACGLAIAPPKKSQIAYACNGTGLHVWCMHMIRSAQQLQEAGLPGFKSMVAAAENSGELLRQLAITDTQTLPQMLCMLGAQALYGVPQDELDPNLSQQAQQIADLHRGVVLLAPEHLLHIGLEGMQQDLPGNLSPRQIKVANALSAWINIHTVLDAVEGTESEASTSQTTGIGVTLLDATKGLSQLNDIPMIGLFAVRFGIATNARVLRTLARRLGAARQQTGMTLDMMLVELYAKQPDFAAEFIVAHSAKRSEPSEDHMVRAQAYVGSYIGTLRRVAKEPGVSKQAVHQSVVQVILWLAAERASHPASVPKGTLLDQLLDKTRRTWRSQALPDDDEPYGGFQD